jgi:hypothetical protein
MNFKKEQRMRFVILSSLALVALFAVTAANQAKEPKTLLTQVGEWQYPGSKIQGGATAADAATVNRRGERTVPSSFSTTVLVTKDPMAKVVEYYKAKLKQPEDAAQEEEDDESPEKSGRSVMFHEDSEGRPVGIQIIVVNTSKTSTTLVISRGDQEAETHIAWSHYERH